MENTAPYIVRLHHVAITMFVGVNDWERDAKQRVSIAVELHGADPGSTTNLTDCIDYSLVHKYIMNNWPNKPHTELLETLADELLGFCLKIPLVSAGHVTLSKPDVFDDGTVPSVTLYREKAPS